MKVLNIVLIISHDKQVAAAHEPMINLFKILPVHSLSDAIAVLDDDG